MSPPLFHCYVSIPKGEADRSVDVRIEGIITDSIDRPQVFRDWFGLVARQQALGHKNQTLFKHLLQNIANVDVLSQLRCMKGLGAQQGPRAVHVPRSRGREDGCCQGVPVLPHQPISDIA